MSSSKTKKVRYERGTKQGDSRGSRDSGFGSASDRASLGTGVDDSTTSYHHQRHNIDALQEALDAAYDTIKQLELANQKLNESLSESNKENRQLKREKGTLLDRVEELLVDLKEERKVNERLRRETSPRSATRTTPPPRVELPRTRSDAPLVPQNPPNPFAPLHTRLPPPVNYAPVTLPYVPTTKTYASGPLYSPISPVSTTRSHYSGSTTSSRPKSKDDGKYHLTPL